MKTLIVRYSLTGNNRLLSRHLANLLNADLEELEVKREMKMMSLALDALFNRKPPIAPARHKPEEYDLVILAGPVWMGKIASPLRSYVKSYIGRIKEIAMISVCGGALGKNEKVNAELNKLAKMKPRAVKQLYINDLLPQEHKNDSKATSAYKVTEKDFQANWEPDINEFLSSIRLE